MSEQIKPQDNSTFANFQKIYNQFKQGFDKIYYKFEPKDPKLEYYNNPEQDRQLKLLLLTEILPQINSLSDPKLFFKQLESLRYGETNPLLLNYLVQYPNSHKLLNSLTAQELQFFYHQLNDNLSSKYLGTNNSQKMLNLQLEIRNRLGSLDVDLLYKNEISK